MIRTKLALSQVRWCGVIVVGLATCAAAEEAPGGTWRFETYPDPMHKGGVIAAAEQVSTPEGGVRVIVRCWSATDEVDVRFVLSNGEWATGDAHWRFDNGAPRSVRWSRSPDGKAIVVPVLMRNDFMKGLRSAKDLSLSSDDQGSFRISLAGSSRSIDAVQKLCP